MKTIDAIHVPFVFTNTGERINLSRIKGEPRVGATLDDDNNVTNSGLVDPDCVGGQCPIK